MVLERQLGFSNAYMYLVVYSPRLACVATFYWMMYRYDGDPVRMDAGKVVSSALEVKALRTDDRYHPVTLVRQVSLRRNPIRSSGWATER